MTRTPTPEQQTCIAAAVDESISLVKIKACAGAGKTSTLGMMAEALPLPSLYLAFNKVTANEAGEKFPKHVTCKTTHSVAYAAFGSKLARAGKLERPRGAYVNVAGTGSEVARFFRIQPLVQADEVVLPAAFIGLLVKTTVAHFEQSADMSLNITHTPYGELMEKFKSVTFNVRDTQEMILSYAKKLWQARTDLDSEVLASHDTYLKMFQLSKPVLAGFDVLYVDEFQDTTPCVLDIVMNQQQHMKIVMVGDARQAIYGWRGAVNAMKMVDAPTRVLSKSFRYGQAVADIATTVLEGAMKITGNEKIASVVGFTDKVDRTKPHTRLFRTNSALLSAAIAEIQRGTKVSIEIDVRDFVKLLQSAVALKNEDKKNVKHDKILPYVEWNELMEESTHDAELNRIAKVITNGQADEWIATLEKHKNVVDPHVTFTTAHKSKGREFSQVIVEGDFKSAYNENGEFVGLSEEEQNLLYVACTRAINVLEYNQTVVEYIRAGRVRPSFDEAVNESISDLKQDVREAIAA
jgi:Superfamily I DNA and RNA helicases